MRGLTLLCPVLLLACFARVSAQAGPDSTAAHTPAPLCYRARPKPTCSAFLLTNFGSYVVLGRDEFNDTRLREVADWGLMANVTTRDAIGGGGVASPDRLGVAPRPRVPDPRRLPASRTVGFAPGPPRGTPTTQLPTGPLFGLSWWGARARQVRALELVEQPAGDRAAAVLHPGCGGERDIGSRQAVHRDDGEQAAAQHAPHGARREVKARFGPNPHGGPALPRDRRGIRP